jgi:hypothetical protein
MKQVSNERQTHQVFHLEVGVTGDRGRGREGKQLRAQRIQGDAHTPSDLLKMALSGPNTPDFYFWKYVKQTFYSVRIHNIQNLKQRIREVAASLTPDVLGRVWLRCLQSHQWNP